MLDAEAQDALRDKIIMAFNSALPSSLPPKYRKEIQEANEKVAKWITLGIYFFVTNGEVTVKLTPQEIQEALDTGSAISKSFKVK